MKGINLLALLLAVVAVTACSKKNKNGGSAPAQQVQEELPVQEKAVLEPQARIITITPQFSDVQYHAEVKLVNEAGDGYVTYEGKVEGEGKISTLHNIADDKDTLSLRSFDGNRVWIAIEYGPMGQMLASKGDADTAFFFMRPDVSVNSFSFVRSIGNDSAQGIMEEFHEKKAQWGSALDALQKWERGYGPKSHKNGTQGYPGVGGDEPQDAATMPYDM